MAPAEPIATAAMLTAFGVLLASSVALSRASSRFGVPVALLFLFVGVLAGSEGLGKIPFDDYPFAFRIGTTALVMILFDGGLNTPLSAVRRVLLPASVLATVGVVGTAALVAVAAHALGLTWPLSMLLGAIVSSTDAAAVFSVLGAGGIRLRQRVGLTLELESGLNDPMAVILTMTLTTAMVQGAALQPGRMVVNVIVELVLGTVIGLAVARVGRFALLKIRLPAAGLYPAFTLALACLSFGIATLLHGSGFLATYVTGVMLGARSLPHAAAIRRVHDALGWLSQVVMFLILGMLVFPSRLAHVAWIGLALALFLAVIARPVVVMLCLALFRYQWREQVYVGWVGLRGAVPIVLATIPVMLQVQGARDLFDLVFFIVVVGAMIPGMTVPWVTRALAMEAHAPPPPRTLVEIDRHSQSGDELRSYFITEQLAVSGATLREVPFPTGAAVSMIERGGALLAPSGAMRIEPGDYVYIIGPESARPEIELLFGTPEEH
jgi:cell volume regulation protein A